MIEIKQVLTSSGTFPSSLEKAKVSCFKDSKPSLLNFGRRVRKPHAFHYQNQ
ncbi:hypothetical protein OFQ64_04830 [Brachyspira hyodysenteriae]|nr:hypothetical protein [Brachyspira hyodysenteriae]MCZ9978051.1 hypothetical protein [Brachyspira hyodysenteriae]